MILDIWVWTFVARRPRICVWFLYVDELWRFVVEKRFVDGSVDGLPSMISHVRSLVNPSGWFDGCHHVWEHKGHHGNDSTSFGNHGTLVEPTVWAPRVVGVATYLFSRGLYGENVVYIVRRDSFVISPIVGWKSGCHSGNSESTSVFGEKLDCAMRSMLRIVWTYAL